jgi:glycosyltransferase involved in cell wall biosynthesis
MKIAQISPLIESVPLRLYGGTERIVSYLTDELIRQGHDVVLFASGDSITAAELMPCTPQALRLAKVSDPLPYQVLQLEYLRRRADEFDILHFHTDYLHFPLVSNIGCGTVTTMHGRLDLPDLPPLFSEYGNMPLVSISNDQRLPLPTGWAATVYHGLPEDLLPVFTRRGPRVSRFSRADLSGKATGLSRSPGAPGSNSRLRRRWTESTRPISAR